IALSVNSISINGWTLPPLAAIGWFLLGILASPLLMREPVGMGLAPIRPEEPDPAQEPRSRPADGGQPPSLLED
ncbi:MAG TPA: hypothetical protein VGT82_10605, partial [Ktedonobacteraceae bacterium]|nr:hypothetical protein [Ktedonobacteraceae bacterium]